MASTPDWIFDSKDNSAPPSESYHYDAQDNSNCSTEVARILNHDPCMTAAALPHSGSSSPFFVYSKSPSHSGDYQLGHDPLDQINPGDLFQGCAALQTLERPDDENEKSSQDHSCWTDLPQDRLKVLRSSSTASSADSSPPSETRNVVVVVKSRPQSSGKRKRASNVVKEESVCTQWSPQAGISSPKVDFNKDIPSVSSQPSPKKARHVEDLDETSTNAEANTSRGKFYEVISGPQPKKEKLMSLEDFEVMKNDVKSNPKLKKPKRSKALVALSDRFQRQKKTQAFKKMGNLGDLLVNILQKNPASWEIPELREVVEEVRPYFRKHYGRNMDIPVLAGISTDPLPDEE